jgi:aromatic-L-amino-acid decarboxylase
MRSLEISSAEFRRVIEEITRFSAEYLNELDSRKIFPGSKGPEAEDLFRTSIPDEGIGIDALAGLKNVIDHCRAQNGRFFGYVLGSGEPVSAAADLLASVLNQNVTAWRSSPAAVTLERTVISWLAEAVGCKGFHGSLTGGGSSANLMALAMARESKLRANDRGLSGAERCTVYASREVHMSIPKAVAVLGIGSGNLRLIATDEQYRMLPSDLDVAVQRDRAAGNIPIAVVASAGTVNTGAIDPLREIAEIARHHDLWLHVDGAYGALAALALPDKFAGLNLADSISLDPHKWLYQTLDCGCLLFRDRVVANETFARTDDYARSLSNDPIESFSFFEGSLELSRRFRALKLWLSIRYHGLRVFREAIQKDLALARRLAAQIENESELQLVAPVELSAVCFRYRGQRSALDDDLDRLNAVILRRIIEHGRVYLSNATLRGKFCLRACIVNHRSTEADVDCVVPEVFAAAKET